MIKKLIIVTISIFMLCPYLSLTSSAENLSNENDGTTVVIPSDPYVNESVTFDFDFLGHSYTFAIPFSNDFMPVARDIIFYFLLAKSIYTKFKAFPSLISSVPFIPSADPSKVDYDLSYKK